MNIFLFDMDGVLLTPNGYHEALKQTVERVGQMLGFAGVGLTTEEIAAFEAAGVTSEWDTAAICSALLLGEAIRQQPNVSWHLPPAPDKPSVVLRGRPDFLAFLDKIADAPGEPTGVLERAQKALQHTFADLPSQRQSQLRSLVQHAHDPMKSLTHRLFQEFVLGSEYFANLYSMPGNLHTESYLLQYDVPNLTAMNLAHLRQWLRRPGHDAAIFTRRPSKMTPQGFCTPPEAELGRQRVGLPEIAIAGWGGLQWLAARQKIQAENLAKPAPVHALYALALAVAPNQQLALERARGLLRDAQATRFWERLNGATVTVFEDTAPGLQSSQSAVERLSKAGVHITLRKCGIASHPGKIQALQKQGAQIFPSLAAALNHGYRENIP